MKQVVTFILVFFTMSLGAYGEEKSAEPQTLSLSECIKRALNVWPGMDAAEMDRIVVESQLLQAKSAYILPELKLRVLGGPIPDVPDGSGPTGGFPEVDTDLSELGPFVQARIEALQPIFTFGKLSNLKSAAEKGVRAKEDQVRIVRNEVIHRVKKVYYGLSFLYSLENFVGEIQGRLKKARDRVEELVQKNSPEVTDIDVMRLDVFGADIERRVAELTEGIKVAEATLSILVNGKGGVDQKIIPADKSLVFKEAELRSADYYLARSRVARPEISQLNHAVEIKDHLRKSTMADYYPSFFIGGFFNYAKAPGREDISNPFLTDDFNNMTGGVALGFEQKLSFHMTHTKYKKAKAEYLKTRADRDQALIGIELEIRKAHSDAVSKHEAVKISRRGFKAGRSWVTASTLNFGVGLVPVKELLEAFVAYATVKTKYFDTIHDFYLAMSDLSKVVGEEISDLEY